MKKFMLLALLAPALSYAQEDIHFVQPTDSVPLYNILHQNAPHFMNIPDVPRFALLGKEGKFYMGIGANVKAVALYDAGHPVPDPNKFITAQIPMHVEPGNGGQFRVTAQASNFYFNVVALPGTANQVGAYLDVNFSGNRYAPDLGHAYLRYRDFTAGYTFSIFSDISAAPNVIDFQGINAFTGAKFGMIAWEPSFGKKKEWKAGIGVDMPDPSMTMAYQTAKVTQRVPDIPFYIQRYWSDRQGWFRLSGIVRNLYYRDLDANHNVDRVGWGIKTSGKTPIVGELKGMWEAVYGEGIADYIQDLGGLGMDLMPEQGNPGSLKPVKVWAGYAGFEYRFNPRIVSTIAYGHVRTYAPSYTNSATPWGDAYKYAQYAVANVFWNVNSITRVGAEYLYGRRVNNDGTQAHDNRMQLMLQVSF